MDDKKLIRLAGKDVRYGISRNMPATDAAGKPVSLAVAVVEHENGHMQTIVINEEAIRFFGEGHIEQEIARAISLPADASAGNPLRI